MCIQCSLCNQEMASLMPKEWPAFDTEIYAKEDGPWLDNLTLYQHIGCRVAAVHELS